MSEHNFERQFAAATRRGAARIEREPLAVRAKYDRRSRRIVIDLSNRCTLLLPPELAQGLRGASAADLSKVRLLGPGTTISWPALDVQFSVTGLLAGVFGTRAWMAELGRAGGRVKSAAKSGAARRNGAKGGRPKGTRVKA
jgi:hypothetical protein